MTPEWLTHVLRHAGAIDAATKVSSFEASSIGTGQVGANVRYALSYDHAGPTAPATVVCKFSSRDEASAAAGVAALTYETEVAFYRDLAHTVDISRPHCHFAEIRSGTADVVLVMEDIAPAEQGDQIAGCTVRAGQSRRRRRRPGCTGRAGATRRWRSSPGSTAATPPRP